MVTDAANGDVQDTATVAVTTILPSVTISGDATVGPPCPASETYTAETTLDGTTLDGTYTWELDGVSSGTGNTGNTFEVECTVDATKTLTVTDTANGNITSSITITCRCAPIVTDGSIEVTFTGCGSLFIPWLGIVEIQGTNTLFGPLAVVSYDPPYVIKGVRLVNRTLQTITQFVGLYPSILFPGIIGPALDYPATVEVTVRDLLPLGSEGLSDTIVIPACGLVNP